MKPQEQETTSFTVNEILCFENHEKFDEETKGKIETSDDPSDIEIIAELRAKKFIRRDEKAFAKKEAWDEWTIYNSTRKPLYRLIGG